MSDDTGAGLAQRLIKARRAVVHGMANSLAILANNLPALRTHVHRPDGISLMVDAGAELDKAREDFQAFYGDDPVKRWQVNRLANSLTVVLDNLEALLAHVLDEEGKLILSQMRTAGERARKQWSTLRSLL
jgi:hypothetical protein